MGYILTFSNNSSPTSIGGEDVTEYDKKNYNC